MPVAALSSVSAPTASVVPSALSASENAELIAFAEAVGGAGLAGVGRLDVGLLRPGAAAAREHVDGAGLRDRVVTLVAVDAFGVARFPERRHRQRVAVGAERDVVAEAGAHLGIRRLEVGLLRPAAAAAGIDVHGAGIEHRVVALVAVDARGRGGLVRRSHGQRRPVGAQRDATPGVALQHAAAAEVVGRLGIRRLEIPGLGDPQAPRPLPATGPRRGSRAQPARAPPYRSPPGCPSRPFRFRRVRPSSPACPSAPAVPARRSSRCGRSPCRCR